MYTSLQQSFMQVVEQYLQNAKGKKSAQGFYVQPFIIQV